MSYKTPKDRGSHSRHLWVGSFQNQVTAKDVAQYFERFGPLESINVKENYGMKSLAADAIVKICVDGETQGSFVNYRKISSAVKALETLNGTEILGSKVAVKFTEGVPTRCLWVGSLPPGITEQELKERFQRFAMIHYGKIEDARLAYKQSKNMELRGQHIKLDYGMEPERGKPKVRREKKEDGESDEDYNYRTEEGLDPNLRFTITIPNNDPPYDLPPPDPNMDINMQQEQVDPQILQQVVQSLLSTSGMPLDQSQIAGLMTDGSNGALTTLDPTFLAQLQDTISQAGLFNTANMNALVSNTAHALPDVSRFFPAEDNNNNRGRFYPTEEANERHEEHRHHRDEDYYYDRERLIDRNLSRFYNGERDRNYSRDGHRIEPRGSSPPRDVYRNEPRGSSPPRPEPRGSTPPRDSHREPRSNSPSRRSRTPPRDPSQLSEEDLLVQARRAVEAGRKDRAEESRGQKRSSPDNISDRPEKRQKTSADSTPTKTSNASDKNNSTNSSESNKSDSLRKSTSKPANTSGTAAVAATGSVDSTTTTTSNTTGPNTNTSSSTKPTETPKTSSTSSTPAQTKATTSGGSSSTTKTTSANTTKTTSATSSTTKTPTAQPKSSSSPAKSSTSNSPKPTSGTAVSSSDTGVRMEVDSGSGSAPSVASSTNGSVATNSSTVANTTGGSGGAKSGSTTTTGTSGTTAVSGSAVNATGSSSSPSVQGSGSVTSSGGNVSNGPANGATTAASKTTPVSSTPSGTPKAPTAGKATAAAATVPKPVVFVPVKPEPVRNNTNAVAPQQTPASTSTTSLSASVSQTNVTPTTQPSATSTVAQVPSAVQKPTNTQPTQVAARPTALNLLGSPAGEKQSPTLVVTAPPTAAVSNTNQLPPTSNPLAPPGLPSPTSSTVKSVALGFIKNMLEDNPVIPQPPSSPISPPRSPKRIDKPQVWHGYLAKRGTIVCDMVAYFLGGSDLWKKLSPMLDLKERTNLTNLTNFFPTDNTIKPSLLYLQPASKGETFKFASIHRYLRNIEKAGICLGEDEIYRIYILPMTQEEAAEFNIDDDLALFALIVPRPKSRS